LPGRICNARVIDQGVLKWEWVKAVSNTEEGKAFLGKYEERRAWGIMH
jgi:hypothetical protein